MTVREFGDSVPSNVSFQASESLFTPRVLAPPKMKRKIGYGVSRGSAMEADVDENGDRLKKLRITDDNDDEHTNVSGAVGKSTESLYAQAMCT